MMMLLHSGINNNNNEYSLMTCRQRCRNLQNAQSLPINQDEREARTGTETGIEFGIGIESELGNLLYLHSSTLFRSNGAAAIIHLAYNETYSDSIHSIHRQYSFAFVSAAKRPQI